VIRNDLMKTGDEELEGVAGKESGKGNRKERET
jgi:hypothetical protein